MVVVAVEVGWCRLYRSAHRDAALGVRRSAPGYVHSDPFDRVAAKQSRHHNRLTTATVLSFARPDVPSDEGLGPVRNRSRHREVSVVAAITSKRIRELLRAI